MYLHTYVILHMTIWMCSAHAKLITGNLTYPKPDCCTKTVLSSLHGGDGHSTLLNGNQSPPRKTWSDTKGFATFKGFCGQNVVQLQSTVLHEMLIITIYCHCVGIVCFVSNNYTIIVTEIL